MPPPILLGLTEFSAWATATRIIASSALATLVYQFVFSRRPGLLLLSSLSLPAAAVSTVFQAATQWRRADGSSSRWPKLGWVFALFVLSATATIVDITLSFAFGAIRDRREMRLVFSRPSNPTDRKFIPTLVTGRPMPRDAMLGVLNSMLPRPDTDSAWLRTAGSFSDIDASLATLYPGACGSAPNPVQPMDGTKLGVDRGSLVYPVPVQFNARRYNTFGFQQFFSVLQLVSRSKTGWLNFYVTVPVPYAYTSDSSSDLASATGDAGGGLAMQRRPISGVIAEGKDAIGYTMECGLLPEDVDAWFAEKYEATKGAPPIFVSPGDVNNTVPGNSGTMFFLDAAEYLPYQSRAAVGYSVAIFAHTTVSKLNNLTVEFLTFGSESSGTPTDKRTALAVASDFFNWNATKYQDSTLREALSTRVSMACNTTQQSVGVFKPGVSSPEPENKNTSRFTLFGDLAAKGADPKRELKSCTLSASGASASSRFFLNSISARNPVPLVTFLAGAQVCKTRIQQFNTSQTAWETDDSGGSLYDSLIDLVGAVQLAPQPQPMSVQCLDNFNVQNGSRPWTWTTALSAVKNTYFSSGGKASAASSPAVGVGSTDGWGRTLLNLANSGGWLQETQSVPTYELPGGPQLFVQTVVGVEVWELVASLVALLAVLLFAFGLNWGNLHSAVIATMYEFAFVPRRPGDTAFNTIANGPTKIDLLQETTLALVALPTEPPTSVVRLAPVDDTEACAVGSAAVRGKGVVVNQSTHFTTLQRRARKQRDEACDGLMDGVDNA
ncbi:hypothetical protein H9P43_008630 [Blastocladiella emersonii ATCC 22665]|nr:hypothetical protein H9P43_008630 [Blastocladiella emersonii ATCC 22665]